MEVDRSLEALIRAGDTDAVADFLQTYGVLSLELDRWNITRIEPFAKALESSSLMELSLAENPIQDWEALFDSLTRTPSIRSLWLDGTAMGDTELDILVRYLPQLTLESIYLRSTLITDEGVHRLIAAIRNGTLGALQIIDVSYNAKVTPAAVQDLAQALQ